MDASHLAWSNSSLLSENEQCIQPFSQDTTSSSIYWIRSGLEREEYNGRKSTHLSKQPQAQELANALFHEH